MGLLKRERRLGELELTKRNWSNDLQATTQRLVALRETFGERVPTFDQLARFGQAILARLGERERMSCSPHEFDAKARLKLRQMPTGRRLTQAEIPSG